MTIHLPSLAEIFSFEKIAEDGIKWVVYAAIGGILIRGWRRMNNNQTFGGWKKEIAFFAISFLTVFALIVFSSSLTGGAKNTSAITGIVNKCVVSTNAFGPSSSAFIIGMNLRLRNPGKPSTAWAWKLRVTLPGGQPFDYPVMDPIPPEIHLRDPNMPEALADITINKDNYLPTQLLEKTVGGDHGAVGWVVFYGSNLRPLEISKAGTKFLIEFEQEDGKNRKIEFVWGNGSP